MNSKINFKFKVTQLNQNNGDNNNTTSSQSIIFQNSNSNNNTDPGQHFSFSSLLVNNRRRRRSEDVPNKDLNTNTTSTTSRKDIELREKTRPNNKPYTVTFAGKEANVTPTNEVNSHSADNSRTSKLSKNLTSSPSSSTDRKRKVQHQERLFKSKQTVTCSKERTESPQFQKNSKLIASVDNKENMESSVGKEKHSKEWKMTNKTHYKGADSQINNNITNNEIGTRIKDEEDARDVALRCSRSPLMVSRRLDKVKNQLDQEKVSICNESYEIEIMI